LLKRQRGRRGEGEVLGPEGGMGGRGGEWELFEC
jgi:hypothetical protein